MSKMQIATKTVVPYDLIDIISRIGREFAAGLSGNDNEAIAKLAQQIEPALALRIIPERRYRIAELEVYGFKRGHFYKAHRHLIRKKGGSRMWSAAIFWHSSKRHRLSPIHRCQLAHLAAVADDEKLRQARLIARCLSTLVL